MRLLGSLRSDCKAFWGRSTNVLREDKKFIYKVKQNSVLSRSGWRTIGIGSFALALRFRGHSFGQPQQPPPAIPFPFKHPPTKYVLSHAHRSERCDAHCPKSEHRGVGVPVVFYHR